MEGKEGEWRRGERAAVVIVEEKMKGGKDRGENVKI